ncbi:MAG: helix-turn-helix transcriptional regulator [Ignavibacteria bacterium]|nr:helix-turn-helix transcriptional regulator [Ignavibacteria bacterium]
MGYTRYQRMVKRLRGASLTKREKETLKLIADGKTTREIGKAMGITIRTAETYRRRIVHKTGIGRIALLTRYWIDNYERRERKH